MKGMLTPRASRRRTIRSTATAAAVTTAVVALGAGCSADSLFTDVKSASRSYNVGNDDQRIRTLDVRSYAGDITVKAAEPDRRTVGVAEDMEYEKTKPHTEHQVKDGVLRLTSDDCGGNGDKCTVHYTVTVPAALTARLRTGGGDVTVRDLSGSVDARTEGGDVVARTTSGRLHARTDGGNVRLTDVRSRDVDAESGGGNLRGTFAAAPDQARLASGGGNVTVRLPRGSYAVDARTDGGTRDVSVPTDREAPHRVTAQTGGGNVTVTGRD